MIDPTVVLTPCFLVVVEHTGFCNELISSVLHIAMRLTRACELRLGTLAYVRC